MKLARLAATTAALCASANATAVSYCVSSETELHDNLAAAQLDATSAEIRIRTGHYIAPAEGWTIDIHQSKGITVAGGYLDAACQTRSLDAALTILDGQNHARPLTIDTTFAGSANTTDPIVVSGITFQNGLGNTVGGLKISDSGPIYTGRVLVERNIFRNNVATTHVEENSAGGLLAATDGNGFDGATTLIVRDNLFDGNIAPDAAALQMYSNNSISVTNNTFVRNQPIDATLPSRATVTGFTVSTMHYSNNIFWHNNPERLHGTFDIRVDDAISSRPGTILVNNNWESLEGVTLSDIGSANFDPEFVDEVGGDFRLGATSKLIDRGTDAPADGAGDIDVGGLARMQGLHVDEGAYEAIPDDVFADDFEGRRP